MQRPCGSSHPTYAVVPRRPSQEPKAKAKKSKPAKQAAAAANGKPAKKRKSSAADAGNNTGDDVVEQLELSDSDDE